jgi:hypothetical protein
MKSYQRVKVKKTTSVEVDQERDEYFQSLSPFQRLEIACSVRELMRKDGVNYSLKGQKVKVIRNAPYQ